ncbi:hypothetical protein MHBO_003156 [Bonamia ostreae]|uniref:Mevalonate kinase n=1 Tax=Bonamia ostreae TaxID=126728 RepID=A0ABV2AQ85_9EUKA
MAAKPKIKITASAPSKIILTGEHSVVNGYSAVAFTTNFRVYVSIEENGEKDKIGMVLMKNGKICQFVNWRLSQFDKFDGEDLDKNRFDFNERFLKMILGIENEQNQKLEGLVKKASVVLLAVLVSTGLSK